MEFDFNKAEQITKSGQKTLKEMMKTINDHIIAPKSAWKKISDFWRNNFEMRGKF